MSLIMKVPSLNWEHHYHEIQLRIDPPLLEKEVKLVELDLADKCQFGLEIKGELFTIKIPPELRRTLDMGLILGRWYNLVLNQQENHNGQKLYVLSYQLGGFMNAGGRC